MELLNFLKENIGKSITIDTNSLSVTVGLKSVVLSNIDEEIAINDNMAISYRYDYIFVDHIRKRVVCQNYNCEGELEFELSVRINKEEL